MDKKHDVMMFLKIFLFYEGLEWLFLLTSSKLSPCVIKQSLRPQKS